MESTSLPKARSARSPAEQANTTDGAADRVVIPFPVAEIVGTPLRPIAGERIARTMGNDEALRAIRARNAAIEPEPDASWRDAIWLIVGAVLALVVIAVIYP